MKKIIKIMWIFPIIFIESLWVFVKTFVREITKKDL